MNSNGVKTKVQIVDKNLQLTERVMAYLMASPDIFESLPDRFELVILPDDDAELRSYNLELLDKCESEGRPMVFARLSATHPKATPQLFAPVLKAA